MFHQDLKTANVLLIRDPATSSLRAKISDFGLSVIKQQNQNIDDDRSVTLKRSAGVSFVRREYKADETLHYYSFPLHLILLK